MFRFHLLIFVIAIASTFLLSACSTAPTSSGEKGGGAYTDISAAELQSMLANKDFVFVNVHIPFEGDIAGTDLSIPYDEIEQNLALLPAEKDAKVVLYCRSDRMSRIAAETLVGLGYTNVWNLDGGMLAWQEAGLPLDW